MIFYFSGTGNSTFVAKYLAKELGGEVVRVDEWLHSGKIQYDCVDKESIGFVFPVYFSGLPTIVEDFLEELKLKFDEKPYMYSISTCGGHAGQAPHLVEKILGEKGYTIDAKFDLIMPDNYTPMFDVSNEEENIKINQDAIVRLKQILSQVRVQNHGNFVKSKMPRFVSRTMIWYGNIFGRKTKKFRVLDRCIHCGLCERKCPINAIELVNGKPEWKKRTCEMCLRCLHHCPKFAIQYGRKSEKHGQYHHPVI